MKALITADLHLTSRQRDEYRWQVFSALRTQVLARRESGEHIDAVFLLGDITDQKDKHSGTLICRVVEQIVALAQDVEVILLKGNHDYTDPDNPTFKFLSHIDRVTWVNSPMVISVAGDLVCCFPHVNRDVLWQPVLKSEAFKSLATLSIVHQAIGGAVSSTGHIVDGVPAVLFEAGRTNSIVVAGDIHKPQVVGNVTYAGAPYPVVFGDEYEPRFLLFDSGKLTSIPRTTLKKVTARIFEVDDLDDVDFTEGDHVKVVVSLYRSEFACWEDIKEQAIAKVQERRAEVFSVELVEIKERHQRAAVETSVVRADAVVKQFCNSREAIDPDTQVAGIRLVDEVQK